MAYRHYLQANAEADKTGIRYEQARALLGLGDVARRQGEEATAKRHWSDALEIFTDVEVPEAEATRRRLAEL